MFRPPPLTNHAAEEGLAQNYKRTERILSGREFFSA